MLFFENEPIPWFASASRFRHGYHIQCGLFADLLYGKITNIHQKTRPKANAIGRDSDDEMRTRMNQMESKLDRLIRTIEAISIIGTH